MIEVEFSNTARLKIAERRELLNDLKDTILKSYSYYMKKNADEAIDMKRASKELSKNIQVTLYFDDVLAIEFIKQFNATHIKNKIYRKLDEDELVGIINNGSKDLRFIDFSLVEIKGVNRQFADFTGCKFVLTNFKESSLRNCYFIDCDFIGTTFTDCDLYSSNFNKSSMIDIDVKNCKLTNVSYLETK